MIRRATERIGWSARWTCAVRCGDWTGADIIAGRAPEPVDILVADENLLVYGGASALFDALIGADSIDPLDTTHAHIGVGDSSAAAAAAQTDLQAATNKARAIMDPGYPLHTDGTGVGAASCIWQATFASGVANFVWNESGLFNAASDGRMVNRKVLPATWGQKSAGQTRTVALTVTIA